MFKMGEGGKGGRSGDSSWHSNKTEACGIWGGSSHEAEGKGRGEVEDKG